MLDTFYRHATENVEAACRSGARVLLARSGIGEGSAASPQRSITPAIREQSFSISIAVHVDHFVYGSPLPQNLVLTSVQELQNYRTPQSVNQHG